MQKITSFVIAFDLRASCIFFISYGGKGVENSKKSKFLELGKEYNSHF